MFAFSASLLLIPFAPAHLELSVLSGVGADFAPRSEFSAKVRLQATPDALVADFEVRDSSPWSARDARRLYSGDSVELFLSGPGTGGVIQAIVDPGINNGSQRIQVIDYRDNATLKGEQPPRADATTSRHGDVYRTRISIPWLTVGIKPTGGADFGVRVSINDAGPHRGTRKLTLFGDNPDRDFYDLPKAQIGSTNSMESPTAWAGISADFRSLQTNVAAPLAWVGKTVKVHVGDTLLKARLEAEDGIATARVGHAISPKVEKLPLIKVELDDASLPLAEMPSLDSLRQEFFNGRSSFAKCAHPVFTGNTFPKIQISRQKQIASAVGPIDVKIRYFDSIPHEVTRPSQPGRYGAVVELASRSGKYKRTETITLFRSPKATDANNAIVAANQFENPQDDYPERADRRYRHAVAKLLGTATHYESYVHTPSQYQANPDKKWPLIVFLHGSGSSDYKTAHDSWLKYRTIDGPAGMAHSDPNFPFISASLLSLGGWSPPVVHEAIDEICTKYRVDEDQVILCGFSMGGYGTWEVAYDRPERFAALVPVGGGDGSADRMPSIKHLAIWVFNGGSDPITTAEDARKAVSELKSLGANVRYTEFPGLGHGESNKAWSMPELYEWMKSQRRKR